MSIEKPDQLKTFSDQPLAFSGRSFSASLVRWYQKNRRSLPWRELWAVSGDPYHVWVSEIMLQQTVIKVVIPVYERFLQQFPDPVSLARAGEEEIARAVRGLGYYRRFRFLQKGCQQLTGEIPENSGKAPDWPRSFSGWKELSGVGDYTAAAISSICFDEKKGVVDGNVERVFCRIFDIRLPPNIPALKKIFQKISDSLVHPQFPGDFNQGLMEVGQRICTVADPSCGLCPLKAYCKAHKAGSSALAPAPKLAQSRLDISLRLTILRRGNYIGLPRRPGDAKFLKSTEGFFTEIKQNGRFTRDGLVENTKLLATGTKIGSVRHSITRHNIMAEVRVLNTNKKNPGIRWYHAGEVEENLVSNLDRKAWNLFLKSQ